MMNATIAAPNGYSNAYQTGAPSAMYTANQVSSDANVAKRAALQPVAIHAAGGAIQKSAGSHMR